MQDQNKKEFTKLLFFASNNLYFMFITKTWLIENDLSPFS